MSEVLLDFARPLLDITDDRQFNKVIALAVACWNVTLLPEEDQEAAINELIAVFPSSGPRDVEVARGAIRMLVERKRTYFPDNKRFIADYQISGSEDRIDLNVASTLQPSDR